MSSFDIFIIILTASLATILTRILPFVIFKKSKESSEQFLLFEKVMPLMIMIILVFYTLKDIEFTEFPFGISEIIAVLLTIFIHLKYKNIFLSIFLSTFFYMILVQFVVPKIL
ncbi:branched-chain amino acid transporter permease [Aliarcobacter skirrowii]|uniref:Branched-chain amino acid ABC transporter n=1 Tax=Aliarcobacter skirrowii TaxID=28200 RepID=A0A2U2C033_9BACT|nr:AzlD domain-containing protein [Aliarcobacter skirrowii]MDX4012871.1 AzlD domain-containing protein [Aliarcobacter skirrowii]MDX4037529.1 AzlD domain-containing protein [Aliarcobacter skirrowii]PWE20512.1 branched-chain amino acid ABC transporter [Aliarcobacter skirrowii]PWE21102.1 branched-chain amino acid ABC transporter [Aliarcobacter skirrowii]PWE25695.1 branched-chain amino acid ABC transporter [Aliarcobacter skirrowii]